MIGSRSVRSVPRDWPGNTVTVEPPRLRAAARLDDERRKTASVPQ